MITAKRLNCHTAFVSKHEAVDNDLSSSLLLFFFFITFVRTYSDHELAMFCMSVSHCQYRCSLRIVLGRHKTLRIMHVNNIQMLYLVWTTCISSVALRLVSLKTTAIFYRQYNSVIHYNVFIHIDKNQYIRQ